MRNATIFPDDELLRATRVEAAKAGKSISRSVADVVKATVETNRRCAGRAIANSKR